jgi:hypothetical protein
MTKAKLAFLAANPRDRNTPLRQLEEYGRLRQELDRSPLRRRIEITQHLTARIDDLVDVLGNEKPECLYFTGFHASRNGGIVLEDANGFSVPQSTEQLVALLKKHKAQLPRFVFLSTCYSAPTANALVQWVDCAVGYKGLLADDFGNTFAQSFFSPVFAAQPVSAAFDSANKRVLADPVAVNAQRTVGELDTAAVYYRAKIEASKFCAFTARPISVFVSYGGPDQAVAERFHTALEARGVEAFLFTHDASPGKMIHRVMHEGVNEHDWVVLLCSRNSLDRPGVLAEIEESLRKASRGGGRNPLVPVAIDDYVYKKWTPKSRDLATYVRDLVIGDFRKVLRSKAAFEKEVDRLVTALAEG